jgi:serine protein kinase
MMSDTLNPRRILESFGKGVRNEFAEKRYLLSFEEYLDLFLKNPRGLTRNASHYLKDAIDYFGTWDEPQGNEDTKRHYKVFERQTSRTKPAIVGQEEAHRQIYRVLEQFVRQGRVDKLILLHGPNGSSKSSTADALAVALEEYSRTDEGAVYRFNWIFPNDKIGFEGLDEALASKRIGFGDARSAALNKTSFAMLQDEEIMCKIVSEIKENPIFLLNKKDRVDLYLKALAEKGWSSDETPIHVEEGALSSKNKKIFDALLLAYQGNVERVLAHVQVERFFYSGRYRTGIATVEPQMAIDAQDRQLTMDRNLQNIPTVLQNIRLFEPVGELIDANRGFIEYADLLKRPLEAFKYLLTTIEKMSMNLASGIVDLDMIMMASANEKHLDAFKASPDWPSFKGRFELVRVPYLLSSKLERKIYEEDLRIIARSKPIGPHAVDLLARWAVLTRLRQPDPDSYDSPVRNLVKRLDPYEKLSLYDGADLSKSFSEQEKNTLKKILGELRKESQASVAYEGRFGASPREMKMLLYFAAQNPKYNSVSALAIFDELEKLVRDTSVYDYLQFEPRAGFHDVREFLKNIRMTYAAKYHREFLVALNLFDEDQYIVALRKYLKHVVAYIKREKVENDHTGRIDDPDEKMMDEMESLMGLTGDRRDMRESIVAKIASWRVENPTDELDIVKVFAHELLMIARRIYESKESYIERIINTMVMLGSEDYTKAPADILKACEETYDNLRIKFGYTKENAWDSLIFLRTSAT